MERKIGMEQVNLRCRLKRRNVEESLLSLHRLKIKLVPEKWLTDTLLLGKGHHFLLWQHCLTFMNWL